MSSEASDRNGHAWAAHAGSGAARALMARGKLRPLQGEEPAVREDLEQALAEYTDLGAAQAAELHDLLGRWNAPSDTSESQRDPARVVPRQGS